MGKPLFKRILVCVNGTSESLKAVMYAIVLSKQLSLSLKVVYVVDTATIKFLTNSKFFAPDERMEYEEKLNQDGKHILEYVKNLASMKGIEIETELLSGAVATEILNEAESFKADMIFLGGSKDSVHLLKQSNTQASRAKFNTANQIMQYSPCPVLVVNKKDMEDLFKIS